LLVILRQAVVEHHVSMAESLKRLLAAVWREIARWKDVEKRAITAQVTVDPATLDSLDKMYEFTDHLKTWRTLQSHTHMRAHRHTLF